MNKANDTAADDGFVDLIAGTGPITHGDPIATSHGPGTYSPAGANPGPFCTTCTVRGRVVSLDPLTVVKVHAADCGSERARYFWGAK